VELDLVPYIVLTCFLGYMLYDGMSLRACERFLNARLILLNGR